MRPRIAALLVALAALLVLAATRPWHSAPIASTGPTATTRSPTPTSTDRAAAASSTSPGRPRAAPGAWRSTPRRGGSTGPTSRQRHDLLRQPRRIGRRRPAQHHRGDDKRTPRRGDRPRDGEDLLGQRHGSTISYANLDGSGGDDLDTTGATVSGPYGVAIDPAAGRIYWANGDQHTISYAKLDGSGGGGDLNISGAT